jgi:hypothetical protein
MRIGSLAAVLGVGVLLTACGGSESSSATQPQTPSIDPTKPVAVLVVSGDAQTVRVKSVVPAAPVLRVINGLGGGIQGIIVSFAVTSGGGSLAQIAAPTGADGTVAVPAWTLGPTSGVVNAVTASVITPGVLPTRVTAIGRWPHWTVMVYMAADNSLSYFGALNLLQMAYAGVNPEVQVVVQAEFSPSAFAQAGLTPATVNRPNYDTFRYVMDGSVAGPPNQVLIGPATDIGNVNMTDPAQLHAFVQWAQQTAPSEHTALVLWNHGGDQAGLIEDETSAPGNVMTLSQLRSALTGLGTFDILYFEMCLMAGYEPLTAVNGLTQTVVASEDAEYVAGWDFTRFLSTLYAESTAPAVTVATSLANAFDAAYSTLPYSETISAFNMAGFGPVDAAVSQLASALQNSPAVTGASLANASAHVQRYEEGWVADLADVADSIRSHFSDPSVVAAATAVRQAVVSPSFLLTNHFRNGTLYSQPNESRSRGLTIVMPSNQPYVLPSAGRGSVGDYQQQLPGLAWANFLQRYTAALSSQPYVFVGTNRLTLWQIWNTAVVGHAWIEMLLLEPNGSLYGPAFGSISPSGLFSADAQATSAYYEGWESDTFVASGTFNYLAWLVSDPTNLQPLVNVAYQIGSGASQSLYSPGTYPQLSLNHSFLNDPTATFGKVLAGQYSDLRPVAVWNTASSTSDVGSSQLSSPDSKAADRLSPQITTAQIATLTRLAAQLRAGPIRANGVADLRPRGGDLGRFAPTISAAAGAPIRVP